MKKVIAWLLVLALTAAVSIGATLAYLTDTDEDVNVMTLGKVKIDQLEYEREDTETENEDAIVQEFHDNKPLLPSVVEDKFDWTTGDSYVNWDQIDGEGSDEIWDPANINNEVDKMVFIKNKGDYDAYVRSVIAFEAGNYQTLDEFLSMVHLNINTEDYAWEWVEPPTTIGEGKYFVAVATYKDILQPGKLTPPSLLQIALDPSATNEDVEAFGDTYQVLVKSQGIQAEGFDDAESALNEGFGDIPTEADSIPWENDSPIKGIDLRTALHYYEGNKSTPISAKVTNVVFGLNAGHENIVEAYDGTLVDVEQDVPVYAYYVDSGSAYTVYFLADDTIYTPKDSSNLFYNIDNATAMGALKTVDTSNLDVSRTENMTRMFRNCGALTGLDVTQWDTSAVTTMDLMFYYCKALAELNPGNWDTSNVTNMYGTFHTCSALTELDLSHWDTGNVTRMDQMFFQAGKLQKVNAAGWDTGNVVNMYAMFAKATKLETVIATGWDVSCVENAYGIFLNDSALKVVEGSGNWNFASATDARCMFQNCSSLPYLDVTNWNLGKATDLTNMFRSCSSLVTLEGSGNWSCANVESMDVMFLGCRSLTSLDVSNWDVSKVKIFDNMFDSEHSNMGDMALEELIGLENWNVQSVESMYAMFYGCGKLKSLDLSGWNVTNLKSLGHCFTDCYDLESVNFTGWDTPNLITMDCMFNNCEALKTVDLSNFTTDNVKEFSQLFEACYSLEKIKGLENWNTAKGCTFTEMFSGCRSLKELNLSGFDTGSAYDNYLDSNNSYSSAFGSMFSGMYSLEKLTLGENFSFDGNGNAAPVSFPNPAAIDGQSTQWYNAANDTYYTASEIPEKTAATYVAAVPVSNAD